MCSKKKRMCGRGCAALGVGLAFLLLLLLTGVYVFTFR
jgi:hypothetical protein